MLFRSKALALVIPAVTGISPPGASSKFLLFIVPGFPTVAGFSFCSCENGLSVFPRHVSSSFETWKLSPFREVCPFGRSDDFDCRGDVLVCLFGMTGLAVGFEGFEPGRFVARFLSDLVEASVVLLFRFL